MTNKLTNKLFVVLLSCCASCVAQSTLTIPSDPAQQAVPIPGEDTASQLYRAPARGDSSSQSQPASPPAFKSAAAGRTRRTVSANAEIEGDGDLANAEFLRAAGPITTRSDFEIFAEEEAGHALPVYGRQLFDDVPSTFAPLQRIPVPANYALGPGDELLIRAWGKIDLDAHVIVDRNGQISLPRVGILSVAGLRYEQLESYLRTAVGNIYKDFELNVTLGQLRSIQVFVLGNARQPGAYTVSSLSTLVDAIFASGGPSAGGTMRRIQLRRGGQMLGEFDLYGLVRKGDKSHDIPLLSGDVIYIPPIGPQVALIENVNEPGIYELKGDMTIAAVLENAGGLTSLARVDRASLERIEDHRQRRVEEFALDTSGLQKLLKDGDLLRILPLSPRFENAVTLRGNVAQPGRYVWHQGMRVSDLIPSREFLLTRKHWNEQNRVDAENSDQLFRHPDPATASHADMLAEISQSSAEINWDYAVIERIDERDLSTRLVDFNLGSAIDSPSSSNNPSLKAGDIVTIFSRKDLPLPVDKHASFVALGGEVQIPGVYRLNPGETLREVVIRAGGLTQHSYLFGAQLTRASTRKIQEEELSISIGRLQKDLFSQYARTGHTGEGAAGVQNAVSEQSQLASQQSLITQLSTAKPTGRVVLGIKPEASEVADIPQFPLEEGDSFYVPPMLGTVQVTGEVYNANAFRYQIGKPLYEYLRDSGGATRTADVKRIFLIRADGTVVSRHNSSLWNGSFENITLMPGDSIIVPPKLKAPGGFMEELPFITQIISQTAMTGAALSLIQ